MKKFFFILILTPLLSFSQVNTDSLFRFVYDDTKQDTDRVRAGRTLVVTFLNSNLDTTEHVVTTLSNLLPNIENPKFIGAYHALAGYVCQKKGLNDSAIYHQEKRLEINKKLGDEKQIAGGYHNLANSYFEIGKIDKAEDYYKKALVKNKNIENTLWQIYNLGGLSRLYAYKNRYKTSRSYAKKSFDLAKKHNLLDESRYLSYGLACLRTNDLRTAMKLFQDGNALAKENDDLYYRIQIGNEIADCYSRMGQMKNAEKRYLEILELCELLGNREMYANCYSGLASFYHEIGQNNKALNYAIRSKNLNKADGDMHSYTVVSLTLALIYQDMGKIDSSIIILSDLVEICKKYKNDDALLAVYNNLSLSYKAKGDFQKASELLFVVLDSSHHNMEKLGTAHNNIGLLYLDAELFDEARYHYNKALDAWNKINLEKGVAAVYHNISNIDKNEGNYDKADSLLQIAIHINKDFESYDWLGNNYGLKGQIFEKKGLLDSAIIYFQKATKTHRDHQYYHLVPQGLILEAELLLNEGKTPISKFKDAYELSKSFNAYELTKTSALGLYKCFVKTGKKSKALEYLEEYHLINDSLSDKERDLTINKMKFKRDLLADSLNYEKQQALSEAQVSYEKSKVKSERQKTYYLYAGLLVTIILGGGIFNRLKITRKQKGIIEIAHQELGEKNQEILDSISYAKRIQSAILPPMKLVKEYLKESFILYKPKDVVAGDFYWMEHKSNKVLFASADCTGHGVPGAMVSVVCNNALNRSVREHGLTSPGEILDKTREIVIQEFEKSDEEVKDGMDIALCSLEGNKLKYAGAHNPLWIIRNGEIIETKANKQPIGQFDNPEPYTTHSFDLEKGDSIYIFSDGYVDQFGGEKGKKFKARAFRELLLSIQDNTMEEQKTIIDEAFETWRGSLEQIDDVCVIGVRV
jgi:serine phosphatase RsbU (regulator of sigma subunit)/Tfp pilus assembly protein PilF